MDMVRGLACSLTHSTVNHRDTSQSWISLMNEQQFEKVQSAGFTGLGGSTCSPSSSWELEERGGGLELAGD